VIAVDAMMRSQSPTVFLIFLCMKLAVIKSSSCNGQSLGKPGSVPYFPLVSWKEVLVPTLYHDSSVVMSVFIFLFLEIFFHKIDDILGIWEYSACPLP